MPRKQIILDYSHIRDYAERFSWVDPVTNSHQTGYNPPQNAIDVHRLPFTITFLTEEGVPYSGRAVCIGVNTARHTRRLQFTEEAHVALRGSAKGNSEKGKGNNQQMQFKTIAKGEIRQVADILIVEIDGVRFSAS